MSATRIHPSLKYSVVVPVYNEEASLAELNDRVARVFETMGSPGQFELLFINDGSTDNTGGIIAELAAANAHVRAITLRRNCGKSLAFMAGFRFARGEIVITMDGDLQDNPEDIPVLVKQLGDGYDLVCGWRHHRQDTRTRKSGSRLFNYVVTRSTGLALHDLNCGFKAYRRELVDSLCIYGHYHRYIPVQAHLAGFRVTEAPIQNSQRKHGFSKYRAIRYEGLFDLMSILFIHRYGLNPLHFFGILSLVFMLPSAIIVGALVIEQIAYLVGLSPEMVANRPLLTFALIGLVLGVLVFVTGFVCDFILHHLIRSRIDEIVNISVAHVVGNDSQPRARSASEQQAR